MGSRKWKWITNNGASHQREEKEVLKGKKRKKRNKAGRNYSKTQNKINEIGQKKWTNRVCVRLEE